MWKRHINCLALLLVILLIAGCKPTPMTKIIADKSEEKISSNLSSASDTGEANTFSQKHWEESINNIKIDAEIITPNFALFNTYIIKSKQFSAQDKEAISKSLLNTSDPYAFDSVLSKEELQDNILYLKRMNYTPTDDQSPKRPIEDYNYPDCVIMYYESLLSTAPDKRKMEIANLDSQDEFLQLMNYVDKKRPAYLSIWNDPSSNYSEFLFENQDTFGSYDAGRVKPIVPEEEKPRGVEMNYNDAILLASEKLEELGYSDFKYQYHCYYAYNDFIGKEAFEYNPEVAQCYVFRFTRNIDNVPINIPLSYDTVLTFSSDSAGSVYVPPLPKEYIEIHIDDTGIVYMQYCSPIEVLEKEFTDLELLPFENIMEVIRGQSKNLASEYRLLLSEEAYIDVYRIQLGYAITYIQDETEKYRLIPVWDFYGDRTYIINDDRGNTTELPERGFLHSLLTVNAVDGSIIDRGMGY